jgi:hypothetical protein
VNRTLQRRNERRLDAIPVSALTRAQLAVRAQSLRDRGRVIEALELVREWEAARRERRA